MLIQCKIWTLFVGILVCSVSLVALADEKKSDKKQEKAEISWYDLDNCEICKNMASLKSEMHRIKWEVHNIENGFLMITILPEDMKKAMAKAEEGVKETVEQLQGGKEMKLCGFCQGYGGLMAMGVKVEEMKTVAGDIAIVTSSDKEVVKKIQEFGKQSMDEHEKMLKHIKKHGKNKK